MLQCLTLMNDDGTLTYFEKASWNDPKICFYLTVICCLRQMGRSTLKKIQFNIFNLGLCKTENPLGIDNNKGFISPDKRIYFSGWQAYKLDPMYASLHQKPVLIWLIVSSMMYVNLGLTFHTNFYKIFT